MRNFNYKRYLNSYSTGWANTLNIDKRTTRREFFEFFIVDVFIVLAILLTAGIVYLLSFAGNGDAGEGIGMLLYFVAVFYIILTQITRLTILCRRIKDTGRSTGWMFWYLVPFLGTIILFLIAVQPTSSKSKDSFPIKVTDNVVVDVLGKNVEMTKSDQTLKSKLNELTAMKEDGLISSEEYSKLRKKYLDL